MRGLDKEDLEAVTEIEHGSLKYRVLDPVAMLRAKATNVREIDQAGPPPRQDSGGGGGHAQEMRSRNTGAAW